MNEAKFKIKYIFFILAVFICHTISYAKTIDLNGVKVSLTAEVVKKESYSGYNVNENNDISTTEYEKEKREREDRYVKTALSIRNNNPYETVNITIIEKSSGRFKQLESNKNDKKITLKVDSKKEKIIKYNYKYEKGFVFEHFNKIVDGEDIFYDDTDNDLRIIDVDKDIKISNFESKENLEDKERDKTKNLKIFLIIFICVIISIVVVYGFILFIRSLKDKDIDFDNYNGFNLIIFIVALSLVLGITSDKKSYANNFEPIIYQKGQSFTKTLTESVLFNDRYYNFSYEITIIYENKHEITDYEADTDGDLLVDALEYLYMTDVNDKDTDSDGLSDYLEVMIMNYNPNSKWTYNDGRNDGYRDYDEDGITNKKELEIGTDPILYDTDGDNLDDYEEVNGVLSKDGKKKYVTDPLKVDSDEDGVDDYTEIKLGLDPTNPISDNVTPDRFRSIEQQLSLTNVSKELTNSTFPIINVEGSVKGDIDKEVRIKEFSNVNLNNSGLLIGKSISVELSEGNINSEISITIDCSNYGDRIKKLTFVKYENGMMEYVDTDVDGENITAKVSNGNYAVVDVEQYLRKLNIYVGDY